MTDMFLLFEWTEEREGKIHHGIYSTMAKAQAASQVFWERRLTDHGAEPEEIGPVKWTSSRNTIGEEFHIGIGTVAKGADRDLLTGDEEDTPFEIEVFTLDVANLSTYDFGGDYTKPPTYRENKVAV